MRIDVRMDHNSPLHNAAQQYAKDKGVTQDRAYMELLAAGLEAKGYE